MLIKDDSVNLCSALALMNSIYKNEELINFLLADQKIQSYIKKLKSSTDEKVVYSAKDFENILLKKL